VRIDTTLIGFNGTSWERGNRSYIFQASNDGSALIIELDHMRQTYNVDKITVSDAADGKDDGYMYEPDESVIETKLTSPNLVTFLDIEKIEFERNRTGIWGWRSDKSESINGYECKVYKANNLQLVTKTRVEHLNSERAKIFMKELEESDLQAQLKNHSSSNSLPGFLSNFFQGNEQRVKIDKSNKNLTALEYFQKQTSVDYYLNGCVRCIDETRKVQTFNATLSLADSYPLSLHEQVLPIVDLMALNNSHFKKLKEFITLQLPSGFPVKIGIISCDCFRVLFYFYYYMNFFLFRNSSIPGNNGPSNFW
jgi:ankyrin repeat domain-containing protein 13